MKSFLHDDRETFEELITLVAEEKNIPEDAVLRDYYITYLLDNLSRSPYKDVCIFKGGTSLSKCYPGTIERFSEDIDLTYVDTEGKSNKSISKAIKQIEQVIVEGFEYEPVNAERSDLSKSMYVWHESEAKETSVKLEIGAKVHPLPTVLKSMKSYIHDYLLKSSLVEILEQYYLPQVELVVLDISRTFIDKVYAIKTQTLVGNIAYKIRHVYDVVQLYKHEEVQMLLRDSEQLETIIDYAKKASAFYVNKRSFSSIDDLYGDYEFSKWKQLFSEEAAVKAYETLHIELLYTDEKQNFQDAVHVLEEIDEILSERHR